MERKDVKHWQAKYEQYVRDTASSATARKYAAALTNFFKHFQDKRYAEDFMRMDLEDYKIWRSREGVAPRTVNQELSIVRAMWNWMIDVYELPLHNPASKVKRLREPEQARKAIALQTAERLIETADSGYDLLMVLLALTTGMRGVEMGGLEWSHIDYENSQIVLPAEITKTSRGRVLPLRADVRELLRDIEIRSRSKKVFGGWAGSATALRERFHALVLKAGLSEKIGLHSLRHSYATYMLRQGADLRTVQDLLGHKSIRTTALYLSPADSIETRRLLDNLPGARPLEVA
jgi:integrase/recombinase XerD